MKEIIHFLKEFNKNSGTWILSAMLFNKLILLIIKAFVLIYVEKSLYGQVMWSVSVLAFFTPFVGLGSNSGLLRFGSISKSKEEKDKLIDYSFSIGMINTFIMCVILYLLLYFFTENTTIYLFLSILVIRNVSLYLYGFQSVQLRVSQLNKRFAIYDIVGNVLMLSGAILLTCLFNAIGYVIALSTIPILVFVIFGFQYGWPKRDFKWDFSFTKKAFWNYSIQASITNVISQMVFYVDTIIIGIYLNDGSVAEYNAAALIPMNILFLPHIFMKTDFTKIAKNYRNKRFLKYYYSNYLKLFLIISVTGILIAIFLGKWIFSFLGEEYQPYKLFLILMVGGIFSILLRVPLGNMISGLGKIKVNTTVDLITLVLDICLNILFISKFGLVGVAWATAISLTASGLMFLGYFIYYLKRLPN